MASMFAANVLGSYPVKQDTKKHELAEHVEHAEHVEDLQVHEIRLESPPDVQNLGGTRNEPKASLLTLPVEIRLRIYELAYDATVLHSKLQWNKGLTLRFHAVPDSSSASPRLTGSPFTLPRVCRRLYSEVTPMLPPISSVALQFNNFSHDNMRHWLDLLSDSQVAQTRSFEITGWASCRLQHPLYLHGHHMKCRRYRSFNSHYPVACTESCRELDGEDEKYGLPGSHVDPYWHDTGRSSTQAKKGLCDRSLTLDLKAFERQFQAERFERIVKKQPNSNAADQGSQREFQKACYLLRVLDGCVSRPGPKSHPPGRNSQCGTVDVIENAIASFVSDEGDLVVTREKILGLLGAVVGNPVS